MTTTVTFTLNPALDFGGHVDRVIPDAKLRLDEPRYEPGGGGINVSRVMARLGGDSLPVYTCGGSAGTRLAELLDVEGIHGMGIPIAGETRENLSIVEDSTRQQFRFVLPGPRLSSGEWQRCLEEITRLEPVPDYVVASGSLPPDVPADVYAHLARGVRERGGRLVADTSGDALRAVLGEGVYLVKPNVGELADLVGQDREQEWDAESVARDLVARGSSEVVVLSLGAAGAYLTARGMQEGEHVRSPTVPIVSKVGAGDSMVGGLMTALTRGESLPIAVRYGVAAGAAAVMTPGSELCRREDTDRLFERMLHEAEHDA